MLANQQYGIGQSAQMDAGRLDLDRKQFSESANTNRARLAALAEMLGAGGGPTRVSVPGIPQAQLSGGMSFGETGKTAMAELAKQKLAALLAGDKFEGGNILTAPQLSSIPKASGWEKAAGILGHIGNFAGALGQTGLFGPNEDSAPTPYVGQASNPPQGLNPKLFEQLFRG